MKHQGFIALISVMVIGLTLLALTAAASSRALFAGFDAVNMIGAAEAREAARSCTEVAALMLARDSRIASTTIAVSEGNCSISAAGGDTVLVSGARGSARVYGKAAVKNGVVTQYEEIPTASL
jgi:hypothetical protein